MDSTDELTGSATWVALEPSYVRHRTFGRAVRGRRGLHPDEVRAFLATMADELERWAATSEVQRREIARLRNYFRTHHIDPDAVTLPPRGAAADDPDAGRAVRRSNDLLAEGTARADAIVSAARAQAEEMIQAALAAAADIDSDARARADSLAVEARAYAEQLIARARHRVARLSYVVDVPTQEVDDLSAP